MKKLIRRTNTTQDEFIRDYKTAMRYYYNQNDITLPVAGKSVARFEGKDNQLLRSADNRVSANYHQLIVDQEVGYLVAETPQIDVEDEALNDYIQQTLGDQFASRLKTLVIYAANAGVAWLHYWKDEAGKFQYGIIPSDQITPIYSGDLNEKLLAVRRTYKEIDPGDGSTYTVYEYWDETGCTVFKSTKDDYSDLQPMTNRFVERDVTAGYETGETNFAPTYDDGHIPFIPFKKNEFELSDLKKYKGQIDVYDAVYNGFVNDVDDVQQVVLVLTNYGGESLDEFKKALKKDKAIKVDSMGNGDRSGIETLQIEIPVEARNSLLDITEAKIFKQGQGIDPTKFEANNATGAAIKMLYSHLELKASNTETEFRLGISELVKAMLRAYGIANTDDIEVKQTWTRTMIQNDLEQAQIVSQVAAFTSDEAIAKNNPVVEDWRQELDDRQDDIVKHDGYSNPDELEDVEDDEDDTSGDE